jgi:hypothetical protein
MRLLLGLGLIGSAFAFAAVSGCHSTEGTVDYTEQSELLLLDLEGTWHSTRGAAPRSHVLWTQTRLPAVVNNAQYADLDWTPTNGCAVNHYDDKAVPIPNVDQPAGEANYAGYDTKLLAADVMAPSPPGVYASPVPAVIRCINDMVKPYYQCRFDTGGISPIAGADPRGVWFPAVPPAVYTASCAGCAPCDAQMIDDGAGGMTAACVQHPLPDMTSVLANLGGGGGYSALVNVATPQVGTFPTRFVRILVGGVQVQSLDTVTLDGTQEIAVQWTCDPTASTPSASACPPSLGAGGSTALVGLWAVTSTNARDAYAPGSRYGFAQCFAAIDDGRATLKLTTQAMQSLFGGTTGGSVMIAFGQLLTKPQSSLDHAVFVGAGRGQFAVVNYGMVPDGGVPMDFASSD